MTTASPPVGRPGLPVPAPLVGATLIAPALWGLTYLAATELLPRDRPFLAATTRALGAGVLLLTGAPQLPRGSWWWKSAVLGVLNMGAFFVLLFVAAYRLPGGVAATLGSVQPLLAASMGALLLGERLRPRIALSGLLGVAGVAVLVLRPGAALDAVGVSAGLAGAACMASGTVLVKRWGRPGSLVAFTSWQLVAGGLLLLPITVAVEGAPHGLSVRNLGGLGWFAGSTALAYVLWFRGVAALPVARVSLLGLVSPVVANLAGWVVLGQRLGPVQVLGAATVLVAVVLGQTGGGVPPSADRALRPHSRVTPGRGSGAGA